jgi:hypothetical protein
MKPIDGRPEMEVLRLAARVRLVGEPAQRLTSLLGQNLDWAQLVELARMHGVAQLLAWHLPHLGETAVPKGDLTQLRTGLQQQAIRNLLLTRELLELLDVFRKEGIAALPFKGPSLAAGAYGNVALRSFGDLDVLVAQRDVARARGFLLARGYSPPTGWTARQQAFSVKTLGQLSMYRDPGIQVELHTALLPRAFAFDLKMADLWSRRQAIVLLDKEVPCLADEDLLLLLCAHGTKHLWKRLMWVCDVAELLRTRPGLCWETVSRRARQLHAEGMLLLGLALARDLLGASLPPRQNEELARNGSVRRLAAEVERSFREGEIRPASALATCSFCLRVRERLGDGLRWCLGLALTPTEADWLALAHELPLTEMYYLLRPVRLAGKHARELSRRLWAGTISPGE